MIFFSFQSWLNKRNHEKKLIKRNCLSNKFLFRLWIDASSWQCLHENLRLMTFCQVTCECGSGERCGRMTWKKHVSCNTRLFNYFRTLTSFEHANLNEVWLIIFLDWHKIDIVLIWNGVKKDIFAYRSLSLSIFFIFALFDYILFACKFVTNICLAKHCFTDFSTFCVSFVSPLVPFSFASGCTN